MLGSGSRFPWTTVCPISNTMHAYSVYKLYVTTICVFMSMYSVEKPYFP
uniref:Uncharacterized protein n=1 Tax=Arundo donax TaxID=35708 RepID=A0A0A9EI12_ARUDO